MTKEDLILKLSDLEWEDFEVKTAKAELPKDCWETVSAFSNTTGGWLLFGIKQNGKTFDIQGVENPEKIEQDFLNTIRGGKMNVFIPTIQAKHDFDGKTVLAFYIPVSKVKPVYYNSLQNTFIRRGSSDQRATNEEIDAMYRDQTFGTKTSELAPGSSRNDIDDKSLKEYRDYMSRFNPDVSYNRYDEEEFLQKLRILDNGICTYSGLLFLGKRDSIEKYFADFRIDLLEIPGTSISDAYTNYTFRLDEYENLWDYYFACFKRLKPNVDVSFKLTSEGFGEELSPGLKAMREALVNMLMHADYFSPAHSRIRIFTNHIEFFNPGGLPKPLEELKEKDISLPRNPIISKLFRMVRLAENAGYGFDKIESNWKLYNGTEPAYELAFDTTIVKLNTHVKQTASSESIQRTFKERSEKLRKLIPNGSLVDEAIRTEFQDSYEAFILYLENDFGKASEKLRDNFGITSEKLRNKFGTSSEAKITSTERRFILLILIALDETLTAEKASRFLNVSDRTIETDFNNLKENQIIERIGSRKEGNWNIITNE